MSNTISPWVATASSFFVNDRPEAFRLEQSGYTFTGYLGDDSFFIKVAWDGGGQLVFRPVYSGGGPLRMLNKKSSGDQLKISFESVVAKFELLVGLTEGQTPILHYTTTLTPHQNMVIPFWPRDIIAMTKKGNAESTKGQVLVKQVGTRSGQLYFHLTKPGTGAVFYLQNLTALADYCERTQTSAAELVGGEWPELGMTLPPNTADTPLKAGEAVVISDAFVTFAPDVPANEAATARQYLELMAMLYLTIPKPNTNYQPWPDILEKGLKDLLDSPGCWQQVAGDHYFNAYVSDYATPPEIMVQLAVLMPLIDYTEWSGKEQDAIERLKKGLPAFYDEKLGTVMRWHPKRAESLEGEEEQKKPSIMDSWYLHHPLINLSRLALKGDKEAKKLFLDSIGFAMKVAKHFNYNWPVFYNVETLEVIKAETQEGKGGEKDVPGLYAHVMLQAWEITGEKRYLAEAEKAAKYLKGTGFDLMYQANNTAFSAGALLRMYKITKKAEYLDMSYMCLASLFKNVRLWDCNYGYGKNFPSFFTLFPLNDAPYSAAYEEEEVFCALHDYLHHAQDVELFAPARLLIAEYIRYLVDRAVYYYPPMLPKEMLQETPKIGEIDPNLWIALEDLDDGWEKSGQVGQEVYGAGNAFGILPRHYIRVPEAEMFVYADYPVTRYAPKQSKPVTFKLAGDGRINCRIMMIKTGKQKLPYITVLSNGEVVNGKSVEGGNWECFVPGDAEVKVSW